MKLTPFFALGLALAAAATSLADEGMWLFSALPKAKIQAAYGFTPDDAWIGHVMKSSIRFDSGGSGSFVSADGLAITNHHVGLDALQKMSSETKNFVRDGFYAKTQADEVKCLDLELNVLDSTEDVTARVNAAVPADLGGDEAAKARRKVIAEIESESHGKTGLRSDVITLFQGGAYHLYRYKRYTDVRLVFAPEQQIAFYGGDPDNFEFPRYDLDFCIFRVYEDNQPVHPAHFLKWSVNGVKAGDLVFVSGNPGRTERLFTLSQLKFARDIRLPATLTTIKRRDGLLTAWSARSDENLRRAKHDLFSARNSRKVYDGQLAGLQTPSFLSAKDDAETTLKARFASLPGGNEALEAYRGMDAAQMTIARIYPRFRMLESFAYPRLVPGGFNSDLFVFARALLRAGDERPKPNGERLPEFSEAQKDTMQLDLFSEKPVYEDLEILTLTDSLAEMTEILGADDQAVRAVLAGKSPHERASELVRGTKLRDLAFRHSLYDGGAAAVAAANDPMIEVARTIDVEARSLRRTYEAADEACRQAQAVIGKTRFAAEGASTYPDATFTLRLSYGSVKGYTEDGVDLSPVTRIAGLYQRADQHHNHEPFDLPESWERSRSSVRMDTPFDFVSDCDVIGGYSGSPTIDRNGEFVGIIFDGNSYSTSGNFGFDTVRSRAISTHSAAILEALRNVYHVPVLADELVNAHR
ncbi:MAG TPA: S46 family peptidase [Opitutaceae bacterium]|jgi:hypothetical protein|nr:S46 family peptidase [Opitutaceae bacterium]